MKRFLSAVLVIILVVLCVAASADPARFLNKDKNSDYHWWHLLQHIGSQNCMVSGNYIKVRPDAGSNKVIGHLEKADSFILDDVQDGWARITVIFHAKTSPDSYVGLSGWVNADYVECQCSSDEYYSGPARTTYSLATVSAKTANLREEPTKSSPNHAKIKKGEQVEVLGEYTGKDKKTWYRVRYGEKVGFLRSDMIDITQTDIPETGVGVPDQDSMVVTLAPDAFDPIIDPIPATPEPTQSDTDAGESGWQQAYHDFILNHQYRVKQVESDDPDLYADSFGNVYDTSSYTSICFGLYDMDHDGTPELIADNGYTDGGWSETHIYTSYDGKIIYIGSLSDRAGGPYITTNANYPGIVTRSGNMGYFGTEYTELLQTGALSSQAVYIEDYADQSEDGSWLEAPMIDVITNDDQLYQTIKNGVLVSIAWYKAEEANESNWSTFIASAFTDWTQAQPTATPFGGEATADNNSDSLDGNYIDDEYFGKYIPIKVYADRDTYRAGEPITFSCDILGGTPTFKVRWEAGESQTRDAGTPLDQYYATHEDHESWAEYTTSDRHVEFTYTPPVLSIELYGSIAITDANGITNYLPSDDVAEVVPAMDGQSASDDIWGEAKNFPDVLLDSTVYPGNWQDTYLQILRNNEQTIRHHIIISKEAATYRKGSDFFIMFYDLTRDGIPEMLFIKSENTEYTDSIGDLYIYSNDGNQTKCVLGIPGFYSPVWVGENYSIYLYRNQPNILGIYFYDGGTWQTEFDVDNHFARGNTYRSIWSDGADDEYTTRGCFLNGYPISEDEWKAALIDDGSNSIYLLASLDNPDAAEIGMDFDAAVQYLSR